MAPFNCTSNAQIVLLGSNLQVKPFLTYQQMPSSPLLNTLVVSLSAVHKHITNKLKCRLRKNLQQPHPNHFNIILHNNQTTFNNYLEPYKQRR
eukprot:15318105-Ditylum_brightwellii.AAC.1